MKDLTKGKYSHEEVRSILHMEKGSREIKFRYDLLTKEEEKKGEMTEVVSGSVEFQAFNTIKRTATFKIKDTNEKVNIQKNRGAIWGDYEEQTWENMNEGGF